MAWLPRAARFILGKAEGVAPRGRQRCLVHLSGNESRHVANHQPQGASDGCIGPVAWSEAARVAVDVQLPGKRPVDDNHGRRTASGGLAAGDIKLRLQDRSDGSDQHWKVLWAAA